MSTLIDDPARQHAQDLSARLGNLAAELPTQNRPPVFTDAASPGFLARLSAILHYRRQRDRTDHAMRNLQVHEFSKG